MSSLTHTQPAAASVCLRCEELSAEPLCGPCANQTLETIWEIAWFGTQCRSYYSDEARVAGDLSESNRHDYIAGMLAAPLRRHPSYLGAT